MRAGVYVRISEDRSGDRLGVQRQLAECQRLCADKGWAVAEVYTDNDTSAATGKHRPAYEKMLADARANKINAIVTWDLDRLHRRPIELEAFMALADEKRLALATVSGDVDLSTAQGQLVARLKGAVARHEIDHKVARQRAAFRQLAERGRPNWSRAFGYRKTPAGRIDIDPVTGPLVKDAYRAILAGASIGDIVRAWNTAGAHSVNGKPWDVTAVSKFLRKPRNAALRAYKGEIIGPGDWPPLVDQDTWRAAQTILGADHRKPGPKSVRRHLLTGMLICGKCGAHLAGIPAKDRKLTYRCKGCLSLSIRAELIEPIVYELVAGRLAKPDALDLLTAEAHDAEEAESLRAQANTLLAEIDQIAVERAEGLLTGRQAKIATERLAAKLAAVEARQRDLARGSALHGLPLGAKEVEQAVRGLSADRFRAVLDLLCEITILPVGKSGKVFNPERVKVVWR